MTKVRQRSGHDAELLRGRLVGLVLSFLGAAVVVGSVVLARLASAKVGGVAIGVALLVFGALFYRWASATPRRASSAQPALATAPRAAPATARARVSILTRAPGGALPGARPSGPVALLRVAKRGR